MDDDLALRIFINRIERIQGDISVGLPAVRANPVVNPLAHEFPVAPEAHPSRFSLLPTLTHFTTPPKPHIIYQIFT